MTKRIVYKVKLPKPGYSINYMAPRSFFPIHVDLVNNEAFLWFEWDPEDKCTNPITFTCVGTGRAFDDLNQVHLGTVIDTNDLVWHYYMNICTN